MSNFEAAADAIIGGDVGTLESLLRDDPDLVRARSTRNHRATLLHYLAANGVEDFRQKSPKNAVAVARMLLETGAEVDAWADTYGGGGSQTTLNLLVSSAHPAAAGVQTGLVDILLDFGAAIDGPENDSSPLITALAFHYRDAAEQLAKRGARIDTLVAAAALGREDLVEQAFLQEDATLKPDITLAHLPWLRQGDPESHLQLAFVWAAMHRRMRVLELLLQRGVDPAARDHRRWTALHWAAFYGYPEIVQLLLDWHAPLEVENEFGGTPLGQTVWATVHERVLPEHIRIIQMLMDAGARADPGWSQADLRPRLPPSVAALLDGSQ